MRREGIWGRFGMVICIATILLGNVFLIANALDFERAYVDYDWKSIDYYDRVDGLVAQMSLIDFGKVTGSSYVPHELEITLGGEYLYETGICYEADGFLFFVNVLKEWTGEIVYQILSEKKPYSELADVYSVWVYCDTPSRVVVEFRNGSDVVWWHKWDAGKKFGGFGMITPTFEYVWYSDTEEAQLTANTLLLACRLDGEWTSFDDVYEFLTIGNTTHIKIEVWKTATGWNNRGYINKTS